MKRTIFLLIAGLAYLSATAQNLGWNRTSDAAMLLLRNGAQADTLNAKLKTLYQVGNTAERIPSGTTGQRPTAERALIRHNVTTGKMEAVLDGTNWVSILTTADAVGGTNYQTFRDDGSGMTQRAAANFISTSTVDVAMTDDAGGGETEVRLTVPTDGITATQIATDAVKSAEIEASAVGTSEIADNAVGNADLRTSAAFSLIGRSANTTGDVADITGTDQTSPAVFNNSLSFYAIPSRTFNTSVTMPTVVGNTTEIGAITHNEGGGSAMVQMDVIVATSGISVAKRYEIPLIFNSTGGVWQLLSPTASSGVYSGQDFEVEMKTNTSGSPSSRIDTVRIVRTAGSTASTAYVSIQFMGSSNAGNSFTATSNTSTSAITAVYPLTSLTNEAGTIGIGTVSPATRLHVVATTGATTAIQRLQNSVGDFDVFLTNATPEGAITANPGDLAIRIDAGNGKIYVKASGTGNTGWVDQAAAGAIDHGDLLGLADDDHTQYLLLAGRSGGQIATGGTASGDDLTLRSTSNATKGDVIINDQGGNVIIGGAETAAETRWMEPAGSGSEYFAWKTAAMAASQTNTWPTDAPSDGDVLTWHTSGLTSWDAPGAGTVYNQRIRVNNSDQTQRNAFNLISTATIVPAATDDSGNGETELRFNIPTGGVSSTEILDGTILAVDLNQMGAATTQALVWTGSTWAAQYILDDQNIANITGDVDNWNPTNWATSTTITVGSTGGIWGITGFAALPGGTERTIVNAGALAIYIAGNHPDSDNSNRVITATDVFIPPYGGAVTIVYSNNYSKWYVSSTTFNPAALGAAQPGVYFYQAPGSTNQSDHPFLGLATSGTSAANNNANPTTTLPQSWELATGTTATGVASIYVPKNANNFSAFGAAHLVASAWVYLPALSSGTQRFITQFSLLGGANSTTTAVNNAVGVRYSDNVNSGAWEFFTRNNAGSETTATTSVTVAANTPYLLTVAIDKARSEARCYVNGSMVARITGTMPNNVVCGARMLQVATVGTTAKLANLAVISAQAIY